MSARALPHARRGGSDRSTAMHRFLLACLATLLALPAVAAKPPAELPRDSLYQLALPLTDQHGAKFDWRTLRGTPRVVGMFYTSCQYTCPLIVESGKAIQKQLTPAQRARLGLVLISMDPARDTPQALQRVAAQHRVDARWTLATPRPADVRAVAGVLDVRYRQLADGEFNHTAALVLLDADGRELARTENIGTVPDPAFVAAVRKATSG